MASNTVINTNVRALNSHRALGSVGSSLEKSSQRLSSGKKVNSAADDAAGLAITEKMRSQIKGLDMASKNAQDAMSLIQTAEGSISEIESMLQRIRELTVQASNDTNAQDDRNKIASEIEQLTEEIDNMAARTEFNTKTLATGKYAASGDAATTADGDPDAGGDADAGDGGDAAGEGKTLYFQIGANASQSVTMNIGAMTCAAISAECTDFDLGNLGTSIAGLAEDDKGEDISNFLKGLDEAISYVSNERANLGAKQNRLQYTDNNLQVSSENLSASKSRIEDADMASEMMNITSSNVLQQAATAMLAQANQSTSQVVQLLS